MCNYHDPSRVGFPTTLVSYQLTVDVFCLRIAGVLFKFHRVSEWLELFIPKYLGLETELLIIVTHLIINK